MFRFVRSTLIILIGCISFYTTARAQDSSGVRCLARLWHTDSYNVRVQGNYLYVADGEAGLRILDISNPATPTQTSLLRLPGITYGLAIRDTLAYLACQTSFRIVNIHNHATPQLTGSLSCWAINVVLSGNYAYVISDTGMRIISISNPASPQQVGIYRNYTSQYTTGTFSVAGNYAYLPAGPAGVLIIDISNPTSPQFVDSCYHHNFTWGVAVSGNYVYAADWDGLTIFNVSNPTSPQFVNSYNLGGDEYIISVVGSYAYLADGGAFSIINISNPDSLQLVGSCYTPAMNLAVSGNFVYMIEYNFGVHVIDISAPTSPHSVGLFRNPAGSKKIALTGNYAYIIGRSEGLSIVDFSTPSSMRTVCFFDTFRFQYNDIKIAGNYAYLATDLAVAILNIANPVSPRLIGYSQYGGHCIATDSTYAYLGSNYFCMDWFVNPTSPQSISRTLLPNNEYANGIAVLGRYAYIATSISGVRVLNIWDSDSTSTVLAPSAAYGIVIVGNLAYVANGTSGLRILNISNPLSPQLVGTYDTPGSARAVTVSGGYAFIADYNQGLRIVNITNPTSPHEVGYYTTLDTAVSVAATGEFAYVAGGNEFGIYDCSQALGVVDRASDAIPKQFSLKQNYPNPFNPITTIEYTIPKTSKVSLKLFDITGREVGTLVDFNQNPGTYRVNFDGKNLSSGIYFYRLTNGNLVETKKMMLVK